MRLLHTRDHYIQEFQDNNIPPYAILSHTWSNQEVSFEEMSNPTTDLPDDNKVLRACDVAFKEEYRAKFGERYDWIWIDTCYIDKSSSAELTEAINSMYNWYQSAKVCYVYLEDISVPEDATREDLRYRFQSCRWFTRGWTLQELIAPKETIFFDRDWNHIGTKENLVDELSARTRISKAILSHEKLLSSVSVAQKMSWASGRETTRIEDTAYSLLGIFGVHFVPDIWRAAQGFSTATGGHYQLSS